MFALFFLANGVGLLFPASVMREYANYQMEDAWLLDAGISYLPLCFGSIALVYLLQNRRKLTAEPKYLLNGRGWIVALGGLIGGLLLIVRYMYITGWERALAWQQITDWTSAYETRYSFEAVEGQGSFSSALAAFCGIPICAAFILLFATRLSHFIRYLIIIPPLACSILRSAANLQRSALILQVLIVSVVLAAPLLSGRGGKSSTRSDKQRLNRFLYFGAGVFFAFGIIVYARSDDMDSPVISMLRRMVVTPSHTAALYFGIFPDMEKFRGWTSILGIPLGTWDNFQNEGITLKLIGYYANGYAHHANANFVVSAYSAAGWGAVLVAEMFYLVLIGIVGRVVGQIGGIFPALSFILSFHGLFAVSQADFLGGYSIGFLWAQVLIILFVRYGITRLPPNAA